MSALLFLCLPERRKNLKKALWEEGLAPAHTQVQMPRFELPWKCLPPLEACPLYERRLRATTATI